MTTYHSDWTILRGKEQGQENNKMLIRGDNIGIRAEVPQEREGYHLKKKEMQRFIGLIWQ